MAVAFVVGTLWVDVSMLSRPLVGVVFAGVMVQTVVMLRRLRYGDRGEPFRPEELDEE
jgi:hypothetical protein